MTKIISGKLLAKSIKEEIKEEIDSLVNNGNRKPKLSVILVGDDPASQSYVKGKSKACEECGIINETILMPASSTEEEVINKVNELNKDDSVDGILVQLPLPKHIDEAKVIEAVDFTKDVDGFHSQNVSKLYSKKECVEPCTPKGIIKLIKKANVKIDGANAVVIGRSNIVGMPVSKLLLDRNATVTICHSRTANLAEITKTADILIAAVGKAKFVKADMVRDGAVVIDVGVNRDLETNKLCGDVDFKDVEPKASYITKVPGGIGPMTITCLMENTLECYLKHMEGK